MCSGLLASRSGRVHLKHFGSVANRLFFASSDKVFALATEVSTEVVFTWVQQSLIIRGFSAYLGLSRLYMEIDAEDLVV